MEQICYHIAPWIHQLTDPTATSKALCKGTSVTTTGDRDDVTCPTCRAMLALIGDPRRPPLRADDFDRGEA